MKQRSFRHGRLSEHVVAEVQRLISAEHSTPGSRLPKESELADRFQVSRIVVREAMKILEDRGVVEVRAGRGTLTVAPSPERVKESLLRLFGDQPVPTLNEMESLLELRQVLEETSASLAAARATEDDILSIGSALADMARENSDLTSTIEADLRFHRSIMRAAHNQYLEMVADPVMSVFLLQIKVTDSLSTALELHRDILLQIQARNPAGARQAVRRLMQRTLDDSRNALKSLQDKVSAVTPAASKGTIVRE